MKYSLAVLAFLMVLPAVLGAAVIPGPPRCQQYCLSESSTSPANFLVNTFHYNAPPKILNSGTPLGPYFRLGQCTWAPNSTFDCDLQIYLDAAHSQQIGTGSLSSSAFNWEDTVSGPSNFQYAYGSLTVSTSLSTSGYTLPGATDAENRNFRSQTTQLYFRRAKEFPDASNPIANGVITQANGQLSITLWGSSGWSETSQSFTDAGRGTGFDFHADLQCCDQTPPIITGCPSCSENFNEAYIQAAAAQSAPLEHAATGSCIGLAFH